MINSTISLITILVSVLLSANNLWSAELPFKSNVTYTVTAINKTAISGTEEAPAPTLKIDSEKKQASGSTGVNSYGCTFTVSDDTITFGPARMTRRAGSEAAMKREAEFTKILTGAMKINVTDKTIELVGTAGTLQFAAE